MRDPPVAGAAGPARLGRAAIGQRSPVAHGERSLHVKVCAALRARAPRARAAPGPRPRSGSTTCRDPRNCALGSAVYRGAHRDMPSRLVRRLSRWRAAGSAGGRRDGARSAGARLRRSVHSCLRGILCARCRAADHGRRHGKEAFWRARAAHGPGDVSGHRGARRHSRVLVRVCSLETLASS